MENLEILLNSIKQLKGLDLNDQTQNHNDIYKSFFTDLNDETVMDRCLKFAYERFKFPNNLIELYDISIILMLNGLMAKPNTFHYLSAITLIKDIKEPNYEIIPKIYGNKIKSELVLDLLFGRHHDTLKIIHLVEYIRQRQFDLIKFINLSIRVKVITYFEQYERKSMNYYFDFIKSTPESLDENIEEILQLFK